MLERVRKEEQGDEGRGGSVAKEQRIEREEVWDDVRKRRRR